MQPRVFISKGCNLFLYSLLSCHSLFDSIVPPFPNFFCAISFAVRYHLLVSHSSIYHSVAPDLLCISHPSASATLIPVRSVLSSFRLLKSKRSSLFSPPTLLISTVVGQISLFSVRVPLGFHCSPYRHGLNLLS